MSDPGADRPIASRSDVDLGDLSELGVDVQPGAVDLPDITRQLDDADEVRPFDLRFETAVKHLSVHKYESAASMLREYVANMTATCLEAQDTIGTGGADTKGEGGDYQPVIHVAWYPELDTLVMEDNGMGMTQAEVDEVGLKLGTGTHRFEPDRPGKYGIGLLSGFKGVGIDGVFFMHSRSRRTGEHVKGLWTAHGFKPAPRLEAKLEPGQYGTRFEFPLQDVEIDVEEAIREVSRWSRVPVLYTRRRADGTVEADDEYGGRSRTPFQDAGHRPNGDIVIENDGVRLVHGPNAAGRTVLLDVPIDRNHEINWGTLRREHDIRLPYRRVDVLLKSEDEFVVDGPHAGKLRVSDGEYATLTEEQKAGVVPAGRTTDADVWTPSPAGDRDRLEEHPRFWAWALRAIDDAFRDQLAGAITRVQDGADVLDLSRRELDVIVCWLRYSRNALRNGSMVPARIAGQLDRLDIDVQIDEATTRRLTAYADVVRVAERGAADPSRKRNQEQRSLASLLKDAQDSAGDVWMAQRPSQRRADVAWALHPENVVVKVNSEATIETYQDEYGWRDLGDINPRTIDEYDVPEDLKEPFRRPSRADPNAGRDAPDRELTLHRVWVPSGKQKYQTVEARRVREYLTAQRDVDETGRDAWKHADPEISPGFDRVVLFPSNADETLSDYRAWLPTRGLRAATCRVLVWEYLQDVPGVIRIEDWLEHAAAQTYPTNAGRLSVPDAAQTGRPVLLHHVPGPVRNGLLADPRSLQEAAAWFQGPPDVGHRQTYDDPIYVPMTTGMVDINRPLLRRENVHLLTYGTDYPIPRAYTDCDLDSDRELYAYARLWRWRDTPEYDVLSGVADLGSMLGLDSLSAELRNVIDGMAALHAAGLPAPSQRPDRELDDGEVDGEGDGGAADPYAALLDAARDVGGEAD